MGSLSCWDNIHNYKHLPTVEETVGCERIESRICGLPDDLLLQILHHVPTKDAVATSILSKRWRHVWPMVPILKFKDDGSESLGCFIDNTLQLHKAPQLESLSVKLGPCCSPVDVDVGKWVEKAVNGGVEELKIKLRWNKEPTSFPKSLYTCDTLVDLTLSNQILVDVSSQAYLPSLLYLSLVEVVYKDEESLARLLSSSPVLKWLKVQRHGDDNLTNFTVKVSSLETLCYLNYWQVEDENDDYIIESLVIDTPELTDLTLIDVCEDYFLIENMPCIDVADIGIVHNPSDKFLRSLSSVIHLHLILTTSMVGCCNTINFSRLTEFYFRPGDLVDWLEPLMFFLQNSPKLNSLTIDTAKTGGLPPSSSWNQPSSIPECFSSHLEIFKWRGYGGREDERQLVAFILANSKCLTTVEISFLATCNPQVSRKELESLPRISTSSRLLFPTQMKRSFYGITLS